MNSRQKLGQPKFPESMVGLLLLLLLLFKKERPPQQQRRYQKPERAFTLLVLSRCHRVGGQLQPSNIGPKDIRENKHALGAVHTSPAFSPTSVGEMSFFQCKFERVHANGVENLKDTKTRSYSSIHIHDYITPGAILCPPVRYMWDPLCLFTAITAPSRTPSPSVFTSSTPVIRPCGRTALVNAALLSHRCASCKITTEKRTPTFLPCVQRLAGGCGFPCALGRGEAIAQRGVAPAKSSPLTARAVWE